jgi:uncharacterized protein YjiS (DUF1127 family)
MMTDAPLARRSRHHTSMLANAAGAFAASVLTFLHEWRRPSRSRWELSKYSHHERADLGFVPEAEKWWPIIKELRIKAAE